MNISPLNSLPNTAAMRSPAAENSNVELRQNLPAQKSQATQVQTESAVSSLGKAETNRQQLEDAIQAANDFVKPFNNGIQFNLDDETGKTIVKVVDLTTKEVVRQFPSEEMLAIAKALDKVKGLLVQQKA